MHDAAETYFDNLKNQIDKIDTLLCLRAELRTAESLKTAESVCNLIFDAVYENGNEQAKKALVDFASEEDDEKLLKAARVLQRIVYDISYKENLEQRYEHTS